MTWRLYPDGIVVRDTDGASFKPDPESALAPQRDYAAFLTSGGTPTPLAQAVPVDLAAYAAAAHVALRDGGVTIGGIRIRTDLESRSLIGDAYTFSEALPAAVIDFKAVTGWETLDSPTMQTVALSVGKWVQACYSAYRRVDEARAAGTITTTAQVDSAFAAVTLPA